MRLRSWTGRGVLALWLCGAAVEVGAVAVARAITGRAFAEHRAAFRAVARAHGVAVPDTAPSAVFLTVSPAEAARLHAPMRRMEREQAVVLGVFLTVPIVLVGVTTVWVWARRRRPAGDAPAV